MVLFILFVHFFFLEVPANEPYLCCSGSLKLGRRWGGNICLYLMKQQADLWLNDPSEQRLERAMTARGSGGTPDSTQPKHTPK